MKKIIKRVLPIIFIFMLLGGSIYIYQYFYGGTYYYTKIDEQYESVSDSVDQNGAKRGVIYTYNLDSFDDQGEQLNIQFDTYLGRPLKSDAFLKVLVNKKSKIISWEEVQVNEIPEKAKIELN